MFSKHWFSSLNLFLNSNMYIHGYHEIQHGYQMWSSICFLVFSTWYLPVSRLVGVAQSLVFLCRIICLVFCCFSSLPRFCHFPSFGSSLFSQKKYRRMGNKGSVLIITTNCWFHYVCNLYMIIQETLKWWSW